MTNGKLLAKLERLPSAIKAAVLRIYRSKMRYRLGSKLYLNRYSNGVSDREADLMLACRVGRDKVSYRMIEVFFHLKKANGMDAYRVCKDRRRAHRIAYNKARWAAKKEEAVAAA